LGPRWATMSPKPPQKCSSVMPVPGRTWSRTTEAMALKGYEAQQKRAKRGVRWVERVEMGRRDTMKARKSLDVGCHRDGHPVSSYRVR
jgi:hypothetical protein